MSNVECPIPNGRDAVRTAARLTFGTGGNAVPSQVSGFSWPEAGYTWALGPSAVLQVKLRPGQGDLMVELSLQPFMIKPYKVRQLIGLCVDGVEVGWECAQGATVLGFRVPQSRVEGRDRIEVKILMPDAATPSETTGSNDNRRLGFQMQEIMLVWIPAEEVWTINSLPPLPFFAANERDRVGEIVRFCTGLTLSHLMEQFESLGTNCEFGMVQRACGAEPLGLLRFVSIETPKLVEGLDFGFQGIDDAHLVKPYPSEGPDPEWLLHHLHYGMDAHSFIKVSSMDVHTLTQQQVKRLGVQRRRFLELLASGEKLFVFQRSEELSEAHVLPIITVLRSYGNNALLFVVQSEHRLPGSVDQIGAHLFRGNIDKLAPIGNAGSFNFEAWVSICANAYRLWRTSGHGVNTTA